ncbi:putative pentatricopeptide repeat-containing protein At1g77010, mitochondrial [Aristolochia californica]|uniref:putative pentatricopeptide repeat-containing protein At1g77010, mitochondrial n=1 Tax=Aristolochia californica TaxID=171875 RepID=UPI0035DBFC2C
MGLDHQSCIPLLQSCRANCSILQAKLLHVLLIKGGLHSSLFFGNSLLQIYTKCRDLVTAQQFFDEMPHRNHFSWNTLIEAYLKLEYNGSALRLFSFMPDKNFYSWNIMISGFAKRGELNVAEGLFKEMPLKNAMAWNSIINGYVRHGQFEVALRLFQNLKLDPFSAARVDNFVLASVVGVCTNLGNLDYGKQLHSWIIINYVALDSVLGSSLVNMYGKCGDIDSASSMLGSIPEPDEFSLSALITGYSNCGKLNKARGIFDMKDNRSTVLWNSMIAGYVSNNQGGDALKLFNMMQVRGIFGDTSTFASVLSACSCLGVIHMGKQVHACAYKIGTVTDIIVASVLVDMYFKCGIVEDACKFFSELKEYDTVLLNSMINVYSSCGKINDAREIFQKMPYRSLISWNSMIVGFSQNGFAVEALELFVEMHTLGLKMDQVTMASAIGACASICHLKLGEQIFALAAIAGLVADQIISTSLIDMYCKCGFVKEGLSLFNEIKKLDEVPWNCMMMGYAINGYGTEALKLFEEMRTLKVVPNDITFIAVLSACGHCGLVDEGYRWFHGMKINYGVEQKIEHYSCMIDLLARGGHIEEAIDFIEKMPFNADLSMWSSVLRGCGTSRGQSHAKKVVEQIMKLDPEISAVYVQSSNIYATQGEWEISAKVRKMMEERRIKKNPGCSWFNC